MRNASNNEIKLLRKLSQKKYREKHRLFVAEGERTVGQILENGLVEVDTVFIADGKQVNNALSAKGVILDTGFFDELADTDNPQGILAICHIPEEQTVDELSAQSGVIIATDAIQDPGNMGTIIRTAAWFGACALISGKGSVDTYHPKVVRSTAGATGSVPVVNGNLDAIFETLESAGWKILLLDGAADSIPLVSVQSSPKTVIVTGNEGNGIQPGLLHSGRQKVRIESGGNTDKVESLNAAIATSIALWKLVNG